MNKLKEYLRDTKGFNDEDFDMLIKDMRNIKKFNPFKFAKQNEIPSDMIFEVLGEL